MTNAAVAIHLIYTCVGIICTLKSGNPSKCTLCTQNIKICTSKGFIVVPVTKEPLEHLACATREYSARFYEDHEV